MTNPTSCSIFMIFSQLTKAWEFRSVVLIQVLIDFQRVALGPLAAKHVKYFKNSGGVRIKVRLCLC